MKKLSFTSAKLIPYHQPNATPAHYTYAFTYNPPPALARLGVTYFVIEVLEKEAKAKQYCELITKFFIEQYYQRTVSAEQATEAFEYTIQMINRQLRDNTKSSQTPFYEKMSIIIAVLRSENLLVAQSGHTSALLVRKNKLHPIFYHRTESQKPNKLLDNVAEGILEAEDKLLFATSALTFSLEQEVLTELLARHSPKEAVTQLHHLLADDKNAYRSGAIIIEASNERAVEHTPLSEAPETEVHTGQPVSALEKTQAKLKPTLDKLTEASKRIAESSWNWIKASGLPKLQDSSKRFWNNLWTRYINKNPRLAAVIAVAFVAIIISTLLLVIKPHQQSSAHYSSYHEASLNYFAAQTKFTDGNTKDAYSLITSAEKSLATIPSSDQAAIAARAKNDNTLLEKFSVSDLRSRVYNLEDKITSTTRQNPAPLADLTKLGTLRALTVTDTKIAVLAESSKQLVLIDKNSHSVDKFTTNIPISKVITSTYDANRNIIFYLTSEPGVWQFDLTRKLSGETLLSTGDWSKAVDIASYSSNLYLLSPDNRQVLRYSPTSIGFGSASSFFKQIDADPTAMTSLTINGNIITSSSNGAFSLFRLGAQLSISSTDTPPGFTGVTKMSQNTKSSQLFGFSASSGRVYLFNLGQSSIDFLKQYASSDRSNNFSDAAASADLSSIYVIYSGKLSQLSL